MKRQAMQFHEFSTTSKIKWSDFSGNHQFSMYNKSLRPTLLACAIHTEKKEYCLYFQNSSKTHHLNRSSKAIK
jgi:hypothetical protein